MNTSRNKQNKLEEKLKSLSNVKDKPEIEDFSTDSDDSLKDFNTTVPKINQTTIRKTPRPTISARKALSVKHVTDFSNIKPKNDQISSDSEESETEMTKFNKTLPRTKSKSDYLTSGGSKSALQFKKSEAKSSENLLKKRKLFDETPSTSKETENVIEDCSSDEDLFTFVEKITAKRPKFDDEEISSSPKLSQVSSEASSQVHRFNIKPPVDVAVKSGGYVELLLKALSDAQQENLQWNYEDPANNAKYFTVSHFEMVLGTMMIFFMLDNQKSAIFLEPSHKIVSKLKVGAKLVFCADFEPYDIDNDVKVYCGVTKIKFVSS
ncbi:uncharacterized protein LOC134834679 [Culicoides brevitarsis]|uniref:uncharacterized protein LOC134834679 n=1 Tax=Culicoides brevitarsis TaxID=469753 RepID=UPI00307C2C01